MTKYHRWMFNSNSSFPNKQMKSTQFFFKRIVPCFTSIDTNCFLNYSMSLRLQPYSRFKSTIQKDYMLIFPLRINTSQQNQISKVSIYQIVILNPNKSVLPTLFIVFLFLSFAQRTCKLFDKMFAQQLHRICV